MTTIYLNSTSTGTYEYLKASYGNINGLTIYTVVNSSATPFFYGFNTFKTNNSAIIFNSNF